MRRAPGGPPSSPARVDPDSSSITGVVGASRGRAVPPTSAPRRRSRSERITSGSADLLRELRRIRFPAGPRCPRCEHRRAHRWGRFAGRQRYRCLGCGRTFSDLTGTPFAYSKRLDLWAEFFECFGDCLPVRAVASRLGVHKDTAWSWRHRVMKNLLARERTILLGGVVDVGETWFLHSEKGSRTLNRPPYARRRRSVVPGSDRPLVWVMLGHDERGSALWELIGECRARASDVRDILLPRCAPGTTLVSLGGPASPYRPAITGQGQRWSLFGAAMLPHSRARFRARVVRIRRWLRRFRGVASRYLIRYLAWEGTLERVGAGVGEGGGIVTELMRRCLDQQFPRTEADHARVPASSRARAPLLDPPGGHPPSQARLLPRGGRRGQSSRAPSRASNRCFISIPPP